MPARKPAGADGLDAYRAKRSPDRTPEPFGTGARPAGKLFVVQKHAARRTHYDLRLEWGGVLHSWAVPKGPAPDPKEKRLAVEVEPHPIEYADFEGMIPEGNYGAGAVIVWDRGLWVPQADPEESFANGKLLFDLKGYKLRGRWTLVRTRKSPKDWLLIKERDGYARADGEGAYPEDSILSGRTVEQLRDGADPAGPIVARLEALGAPTARVRARDVELMLAETREQVFSRPGWVFELKYDGYRIVAAREEGAAALISRAGNDLTAVFPEVAQVVAALPFEHVVLDGEIVVHDDRGLPNFHRLQRRAKLTRLPDIARAAAELPATFYAFDLLAFGDHDLRPLPLVARKELLREVLPTVGPLRHSEHIAERGEEMYAQVEKLGLEGVVAKKADAPYRGGRSAQWLKIRADRSDDFVIVGYTEPQGTRAGFGALHVAQYVSGELVYTGRVGTGFTGELIAEIFGRLRPIRRDTAPCTGSVPQGAEHHWVEPELVCEVRFKEITDLGLLRQPVFLRMRDDKPPRECTRETADAHLPEPEAPPAPAPAPERRLAFTNLDKVFWPEEGDTKGDLIAYYRSVADWMLPYLVDRPLVLTRYPDGISGKSFFQKDAPVFAPEWIRTVTLWSEGSDRELRYFVCEDADALAYIANLAAIPLHIWSSRVATLERPDWCILDLDPKDAPFAHVVRVARAIHELCDDIGLPCFVKTSGSTGLHVLIPLGRQCTYEQSRSLGALLARVVADQLPEIATLTRQPTRREGRVYVDYVQNGHGRLLVAPFSVRPLPGAPVSTPLEWNEVDAQLDIRRHTIRTVPPRLERLGADPLRPVLDLAPDLVGALQRLHRRLEGEGVRSGE
jgi:bifunctional non-homologous end joining protein LigD